MSSYEKLEDIRKQKNDILGKLDNTVSVYTKMIEITKQGQDVIENIDKKFNEATKLDSSDMPFLFLAIALQCTRILLQPKLDLNFSKISNENRNDSARDGELEKRKRKEQAKKNKADNITSKKYPDKVKMFLLPVPYDAMEGTERIYIPGVSPIGKQLCGLNHHSATIGHDPIAGFVVGPINILTRTITFKNPLLQTCEVHLHRSAYENITKFSGQYVTKDVSKNELLEKLKETIHEDKTRIPAAVGRHILHIESDKYCKTGLPIPFISPDKAQELLKQDWNSHELYRLMKFIGKDILTIGTQAFISILINVIIETTHKFCYKEDMGISKDLYSVKTHKILEVSNVIASMSDIIGVSIGCLIGASSGNASLTKKALENLDIGGFFVTIHRLATDQVFIRKIKMEYLKNEWYDYVIKELEG